MARWRNINGVLQKIAGSVRIDQVLNGFSRNAISNMAVCEKFGEIDSDIDTINSHLFDKGNIQTLLLEIPSINVYHSAELPTGFTVDNTNIISVEYYNTGNATWYYNSIDGVAVKLEKLNGTDTVQGYTTQSYVTKLKITLMRNGD